MAAVYGSTRTINKVVYPLLTKFRFPISPGQIRNKVTSETGAILAQPKKIPFGIPRIVLTVLPGLYLGATISKEGAAFLEENDIFVPAEDDDDD